MTHGETHTHLTAGSLTCCFSSFHMFVIHNTIFISFLLRVCSRKNVALSASLCVHLHRVRVKVNIKVKVKLFPSMLCRHIQEVEV